MKTADRMYLEGLLELCKRMSKENFTNSTFEQGMNAAHKVIAAGIEAHLSYERDD